MNFPSPFGVGANIKSILMAPPSRDLDSAASLEQPHDRIGDCAGNGNR